MTLTFAFPAQIVDYEKELESLRSRPEETLIADHIESTQLRSSPPLEGAVPNGTAHKQEMDQLNGQCSLCSVPLLSLFEWKLFLHLICLWRWDLHSSCSPPPL